MQSNSYWDEVTTHATTRIVFRLDLMRGEDCVEDSDFENEEENNMDNNNTPRGKVGPSTMDVERERCFVYRERPVHDDPAVRALVKAMEKLDEGDEDGSYYESIDHAYDGYKKDTSAAANAAKEIMNEMIKNQQRHIQQQQQKLQQSMSSSRPVSISIDNFSCGSPQSCISDGPGSSEESGASTSTATLGAISPTSSSTYLGIFSPSDPKHVSSKQQIIVQVVESKSKQQHVIADEVDEDMVDVVISESDGDEDELEEDGKPTKTVKEGSNDNDKRKKRHRHRRYSNKFGIRNKKDKDKVKDTKKEKPMPKEIALSESSSGLDDDDNKDKSGGSKIRRRIRRKRSVAGVPRSAVGGGSFSDSEMVSDYATGFVDDEDHVKHDANHNRKYYSLRRIYKDDEGKHCIVS